MRTPRTPTSLALLFASVVSACGSDVTSDAPPDADGESAVDGDPAEGGDVPGDTTPPGDAAGTCPGDVLAPFEGGASYYAKWSHGPPSSPTFFPISVWLQSPSNAPRYAAIGINQYIGLYGGPTEAELSTLTTAKMPAFCDQNGVGLAHVADPVVRGWTQQDEPDNAQPDGKGGYGPCVDPAVIASLYATWRSKDATRPVYLNFGQGASDTAYIGRGSACSGKTDMYPKYIAGADVVSFDIYPVNNAAGKAPPKLWMVAQGVDNLRTWAAYKKPVWVWIETTSIDGAPGPTPAHVRMEVWSALVHGALGIGYFAHQIGPKFVEAGLLADTTMSKAVSDLDAQIAALAPALNVPSIANGVKVTTSASGVPVDTMVKRKDGVTYVFAVGMRDGATTAKFEVTCLGTATKAEVVGEARTVDVASGVFSDAFAPYAVHIYRIGS